VNQPEQEGRREADNGYDTYDKSEGASDPLLWGRNQWTRVE